MKWLWDSSCSLQLGHMVFGALPVICIAGFYFNFRLDTVVRNFTHVNEFVSITKLTQREDEIPIYFESFEKVQPYYRKILV